MDGLAERRQTWADEPVRDSPTQVTVTSQMLSESGGELSKAGWGGRMQDKTDSFREAEQHLWRTNKLETNKLNGILDYFVSIESHKSFGMGVAIIRIKYKLLADANKVIT